MPDILHTLYFIEAQGYTIDKKNIYQDNQSTIRLDVNGRISSGKKAKHISSPFFFITDKISKGGVDVEYCPTGKMWCDIVKKPKQGAPYRLDRSHLMNVPWIMMTRLIAGYSPSAIGHQAGQRYWGSAPQS